MCFIESVIDRRNGLGTQIGCFNYVGSGVFFLAYGWMITLFMALSAIMDREETSLGFL
jgi:hypothetical protein